MVSGSRIFMHSVYVRAHRKAHAAAGHGPITCPHGTRHRLIRLSPHANTEQCRRSEEHTSELQSRGHLVCRLLLEKKKPINTITSSRSSVKFKSINSSKSIV